MSRNFQEMFEKRSKGHGLVVELSLDEKKLSERSPLIFVRNIIEATKEHAAAYVINSMSYLAYGLGGQNQIIDTRKQIFRIAPEVPAILGDLGRLSMDTARFAFDVCDADAVITLSDIEEADVRERYPKKGMLHRTGDVAYGIEDRENTSKAVIMGCVLTEDEYTIGILNMHPKSLLKVGHEVIYAGDPKNYIAQVKERAQYYDQFVMNERAKKAQAA